LRRWTSFPRTPSSKFSHCKWALHAILIFPMYRIIVWFVLHVSLVHAQIDSEVLYWQWWLCCVIFMSSLHNMSSYLHIVSPELFKWFWWDLILRICTWKKANFSLYGSSITLP
jgi:hypothetical protein